MCSLVLRYYFKGHSNGVARHCGLEMSQVANPAATKGDGGPQTNVASKYCQFNLRVGKDRHTGSYYAKERHCLEQMVLNLERISD